MDYATAQMAVDLRPGVFPEVCKWIIHGGNGESKSAFTYAQDSAPEETDTSGGYGLTEVQSRQCAAFFYYRPEQ